MRYNDGSKYFMQRRMFMKKKWFSAFLSVLMMLSSVSALSYADSDFVLNYGFSPKGGSTINPIENANPEIKVFQGRNFDKDISQSNEFNVNAPFLLKAENLHLNVWESGTEASEKKYVEVGDEIEIRFGDKFELVQNTPAKPIAFNLNGEQKELGTLEFINTPQGVVGKIVIGFDVFGVEESERPSVVSMNFSLKMELADKNVTGSHNLFGRQYLFVQRALPADYTGTKNGVYDPLTQTVTWTITASSSVKGSPYPLSGTTFVDPIGEDVGQYVENTFKVNGELKTPDLSQADKLKYVFPDDPATTEATIEFQTDPAKDKVFKNIESGSDIEGVNNYGSDSIRNVFELYDVEGYKAFVEQTEVPFTPIWIKKYGKSNASGSEKKINYITWTIELNPERANLTEVVFKDRIPSNFRVEKATINKNGVIENLVVTPNNEVIYQGDLSDRATVEIIVEKKTTAGAIPKAESFSNTAEITSKEMEGVKVYSTDVATAGANLIEKRATRELEWTEDGLLAHWEVTISDATLLDHTKPIKVYDILYHPISFTSQK